ncbi:hypothetical protein E2C01_074350 [Portunus trituberculatus]|uniref:Uncharacterized protein n=1 Tax=Portunus trituberculatus TaxID=210409 RepID=A0A5B7IGU9_PORTR|nr:hypothetical protein [Portunus trituberculatus]
MAASVALRFFVVQWRGVPFPHCPSFS